MQPYVGDDLFCRQGNMSEVVIGQLEGNGTVVLKKIVSRLQNNSIFIARWKQEVAITDFLSKLTNVPRVVSYGYLPKPWYIQEFIEGHSIRAWIEEKKYPLDKDRLICACNIIRQLCDIVWVANKNGIVHRDITPDNVIISKEGVVYLIDWGLLYCNNSPYILNTSQECLDGHQTNKRLTEAGRRHGRMGYAAPEQYESVKDCPSIKNDIYSIGILAHELITGDPLFSENNYEIMVLEQLKLCDYKTLTIHSKHKIAYALLPFIIGNPDNRCTDIINFKKTIDIFAEEVRNLTCPT